MQPLLLFFGSIQNEKDINALNTMTKQEWEKEKRNDGGTRKLHQPIGGTYNKIKLRGFYRLQGHDETIRAIHLVVCVGPNGISHLMFHTGCPET